MTVAHFIVQRQETSALTIFLTIRRFFKFRMYSQSFIHSFAVLEMVRVIAEIIVLLEFLFTDL